MTEHDPSPSKGSPAQKHVFLSLPSHHPQPKKMQFQYIYAKLINYIDISPET